MMRRSGDDGRRFRRAAAATVTVVALVLAGCGDDETAQDRYCAAGEDLGESLDALSSVSLLDDGPDGIREAAEDVRNDIGTMQDNASEAVEGDVAALGEALTDLEDQFADLGDEFSVASIEAITAGIGRVLSAAGDVIATLSDC